MEKKHQYHQEPMQEKTTRHAKMVGREEKESVFEETSGREKEGVEEKEASRVRVTTWHLSIGKREEK
jgi:hypothetical protein